MSDLRDFTGKNRKFTGTIGERISVGTTAERDTATFGSGTLRFNSNTNLLEYYDGTAWREVRDLNNTITTQGDILYRDGSGLARLAAGTSGQFLQTTGTGENPTWATVSSKIIEVTQVVKTDAQTFSGLSTTFADITGLSITVTPQSTASKFLLMPSVYLSSTGNPTQTRLMRDATALFIGDAASSRKRTSSQYFGSGGTIEGFHHTFHFLDEPNTASAVTYKPQISIGGGATQYANRTSRDADGTAEDSRSASSFTVIEVGA